MAAKKQPMAMSYSRLSTFEQCPLKAKYKYIDKLPEPPFKAAERGIKIHLDAENYVLGKLKKITKELRPFKKLLDTTKKAKFKSVEGKWSFDINWNVVNWFSKITHMRVILDALSITKTEIIVDDYKTGRIYDSHADQMDIYAGSTNEKFPVKEFPQKKIVTRTIYIDQNEVVEYEYSREAALHQRLELDSRIERVRKMKRFFARPGYYCSYCSFSRSKGGPCKNG